MTSNILIYGTPKDKLLLCLGLLRMVDLVARCDMMISVNPKLMRPHPKLPVRNLESMHPMPKHIRGLDNRAIT